MCTGEASGEGRQQKGVRAEILGQTLRFQVLAPPCIALVSYLTSLSLSHPICKMGKGCYLPHGAARKA